MYSVKLILENGIDSQNRLQYFFLLWVLSFKLIITHALLPL